MQVIFFSVVSFSNNLINFRGEIAALVAAFLWAVSSTIYSILGTQITPLKLNLYKGIIAIFFIITTLILRNQLEVEIPTFSLILLLISGIVGIGLGDTAYFNALKYLGARRTLLLETLAPPLSAFFALIFLGEKLAIASWCGIVLTIIGIAWVISERTTTTNRQNSKQGLTWGILAALAQAIGAVLSRAALVESNINPLSSTLIRLIGATIIIIILLSFSKNKINQNIQSFLSLKLIITIIITAFMSTYLGIWLQQTSLKYAPAGIAQTLMATSPIFVIPLAAIMGDKITLRAICGVLLSLSGIAILFIFI
jgi:drug/metabolite transporter (DMT)-like permease